MAEGAWALETARPAGLFEQDAAWVLPVLWAVPLYPKLDYVRVEVQKMWVRSLRRRSQRRQLSWDILSSRARFLLPDPEAVHRIV
jgi:hypothetical protein